MKSETKESIGEGVAITPRPLLQFYRQGGPTYIVAARATSTRWITAMPLRVDGTRTTASARPQTRPQMLGGAHPRSADLSYPPAPVAPARCRSFSPAPSYRFVALASAPQFPPPVHRVLDKGWRPSSPP